MPRGFKAQWSRDPLTRARLYAVTRWGETIVSGLGYAETHRALREMGVDEFGLIRIKLLVEAQYSEWDQTRFSAYSQ